MDKQKKKSCMDLMILLFFYFPEHHAPRILG